MARSSDAERALSRMERRNMLPARQAFDAGIGAMGRAMARAVQASGRDPLTQATLRQIVSAAQHATTRVFQGVGNVIVAATADTLHDGLGVLAQAVGKLGLDASAIEDARVAARVLATKRTVFEALRRRTMVSNAVDAAQIVKARLAVIPVNEARVRDAIDAAVEAADGQWWRVERVAVTEASTAFNAAQDAGMSVLAVSHPGLMKRWTELVDDATGAPLDNRVGLDSIALHGQLAKPGDSFRMPSSAKGIAAGLRGKSWEHPPNRPHDRSVLVPWLPGTGVPGYVLRGGRKVRKS